MKALTQFRHYASLSLAVIVLTGCASNRAVDSNPQDPFEPFNREVFYFNRGMDMYFIKPVAGIYYKYIPEEARHGVTNFFSNVNDINVAANEVLQLKFNDAFKTTVRFLMNSTIGVAGLFDVASSLGIYKTRQDFGTTLAFYGYKDAPYLVLPLLGPSTLRDTAGLAVDWYLSPYAYIPENIMWPAIGLNYVNQRANLLEDTSFVDYAAMDPYSLVRDIYLQRRNALINKEQIGNEWNSEESTWDDWNTSWSKEVAPTVELAVPHGTHPAVHPHPATDATPSWE